MSDAIEPSAIQTGAEAAASESAPVPASDGTPDRLTWSGAIHGVLNFLTLSGRFVALATAAVLLKENLHLLKKRMHADAAFAVRVGEMCGQAGADSYFVALFEETAKDFIRVAEASDELAGAADQMEAGAHGVHDAHESEYRGVFEVRQASPYAQPKPGFNEVR